MRSRNKRARVRHARADSSIFPSLLTNASRQAALDAATQDELAKLEERITDANDNLSDTEVREAVASSSSSSSQTST